MAKQNKEEAAASERERFVTFRRTAPDAGYFSFNGYSIDGVNHFLYNGTDEQGNKKKVRIDWEPDKLDYKVSTKDQERIEFLRNSPENRGGPNGQKDIGLYFEFDEDKIIEAENKKKQVKLNAANTANSLTGDKLNNVAAMYGYFGVNKNKLKSTVMSAAEKDAEDFMTKVGDSSLEAKALFYKAVENEVIIEDGIAYVFGQTNLGSDPEEAVSMLLTDKQIYEAIKKATNKTPA